MDSSRITRTIAVAKLQPSHVWFEMSQACRLTHFERSPAITSTYFLVDLGAAHRYMNLKHAQSPIAATNGERGPLASALIEDFLQIWDRNNRFTPFGLPAVSVLSLVNK